MTRFARPGPGYEKKKGLESTPWNELKATHATIEQSCRKRQRVSKDTKSNQRNKKWHGGLLSKKQEQKIASRLNASNRSEFRRVKRIKQRSDKQVCFNCRQPGHLLSECPEMDGDVDHGTGICFRCGSTEHSLSRCRVKPSSLENEVLAFAKCFICGEEGHLSKSCPDNPRGLYPNGGSCRECGSVEHFCRNCPELQKKGGVQSYKLKVVGRASTASVEEDSFVVVEDEAEEVKNIENVFEANESNYMKKKKGNYVELTAGKNSMKSSKKARTVKF